MSFKPRNFREWCNHTIPVLPQVYGDELSYYELLNKVVEKLNAIGITVNELIEYVNNYFDSKDWQQMVNNKLDSMVADGTLDNIINQKIFGELNSNINMLLDNRKNFRNCKILCIGDSFGRGVYDNSEHLESSWPTRLGEYANGSIIYNYCQNDAGFLVSDNTFLNQLTKAKNDGHSDSHIIIIEGGHNDGYVDITNLFSAMVDCVNYAKQNFPNAVIYVVAANSGTAKEIDRTKRHTIWTTMQSACDLTGVSFFMLNMYLFNINNTLSGDGIHPNQFGYQMLANLMYKMLTGLNMNVNDTRALGFGAEFYGDKISYVVEGQWTDTATFSKTTPFDGNHPAFSFPVTATNNFANRNSPLALHVPFSIQDDGTQGTMIIRLRNGAMELCPLAYDTKTGGPGYINATGSKQFYMSSFTITFPTIMIM